MTQARTSEDRPPSTEERYLSATRSSNLRVTAEKRSDADVILAAAFAVRDEDPRDREQKILALSIYNVLASSDMRGAHEVAERMAGSLVRRGIHGRGEQINRVAAYDICMLLLKVWHKRTCPECSGRGHPLIPEAPVQDLSIDCRHCDGTGQIPLDRIFKPHQIPHARWLESKINIMNSMIFSEMAKYLRPQLDL